MKSKRQVGMLSLLALALAFAPAATVSSAEPQGTLASPETFNGISDITARSEALFTEAAKVMTSARCVNCHPAGDRPLQADAGRLHQPPVERGAAGFGTVNAQCGMCHQAANFDPAGVPGHAGWHLAPREMAWQGKTIAEICVQVKDPARHGGRTLVQIHDHMTNDSLVGWAWAPGYGRTPAPGTQKALGARLEAWIKTGASCPTS